MIDEEVWVTAEKQYELAKNNFPNLKFWSKASPSCF